MLQGSCDFWVWSAVRCPTLGKGGGRRGERVEYTIPWARRPGVLHLTHLLLHWRVPNTSRAALRPWTAAVVNKSAGLGCVSVSPWGSLVTPGCASFNLPRTAWTHTECPRVASAVLQISPCSMEIQECPTQTTPALAQSVLHVDDKIVRRLDTACTSVWVVKPFTTCAWHKSSILATVSGPWPMTK